MYIEEIKQPQPKVYPGHTLKEALALNECNFDRFLYYSNVPEAQRKFKIICPEDKR